MTGNSGPEKQNSNIPASEIFDLTPTAESQKIAEKRSNKTVSRLQQESQSTKQEEPVLNAMISYIEKGDLSPQEKQEKSAPINAVMRDYRPENFSESVKTFEQKQGNFFRFLDTDKNLSWLKTLAMAEAKKTQPDKLFLQDFHNGVISSVGHFLDTENLDSGNSSLFEIFLKKGWEQILNSLQQRGLSQEETQKLYQGVIRKQLEGKKITTGVVIAAHEKVTKITDPDERKMLIAQAEIVAYRKNATFEQSQANLEKIFKDRNLELKPELIEALKTLNTKNPQAVEVFRNQHPQFAGIDLKTLKELQIILKKNDLVAAEQNIPYIIDTAKLELAATKTPASEAQQAAEMDKLRKQYFGTEITELEELADDYYRYVESLENNEQLDSTEIAVMLTLYKATVQPYQEAIEEIENALPEDAELKDLHFDFTKRTLTGTIQTAENQRQIQINKDQAVIIDPNADEGSRTALLGLDGTQIADAVFMIDTDQNFTDAAILRSQVSREFFHIDDQELQNITKDKLRLNRISSKLERRNIIFNYLTLLENQNEEKNNPLHQGIDRKMDVLSFILKDKNVAVALLNELNKAPEQFQKNFDCFSNFYQKITGAK